MELLSASPTPWSRARAALTGPIRGWPVWAAPAPLLGYLLTVVTLAVMVGGYGVATTPLLGSELAAFGLLVGCGVVALEATRRSGEPAGVSRDLLSAWTVPIAVLLPPLYALLAPVVWTGVTQLRVGRSPLHRRVFSAAVIGLEGYGRATVFQLLAGGTLAHVVGHGGGWVALALLATVAIGFVGVQLNAVVVALAVRLSSPEVRWRQLLGQRADVLLDLTVGTVIAAAWIASPAAVLALPAMIYLHRTLTHNQLRAAARTDAKTGLLNAATWQEEADREVSRATRTHAPLTVLIADLDRFKEVNDRHGHLVGDQMLAAVAAALQSGSRSYDVLGRFGGEEFTIALPGTDLDEAIQITARLRQLVADAAVPVGPDCVQVTVSIGAAVLGRHGRDLTDLLVAADLALYRAKAAGRNQVSFAPTG
jgi:diguanylate cyclase (GGDEF)-like protein